MITGSSPRADWARTDYGLPRGDCQPRSAHGIWVGVRSGHHHFALDGVGSVGALDAVAVVDLDRPGGEHRRHRAVLGCREFDGAAHRPLVHGRALDQMDHVCASEDCRLLVALLSRHGDFVASHDDALLLENRDHVHARAAYLTDEQHLDGARARVAGAVIQNDLVAGARLDGEAKACALVYGG